MDLHNQFLDPVLVAFQRKLPVDALSAVHHHPGPVGRQHLCYTGPPIYVILNKNAYIMFL